VFFILIGKVVIHAWMAFHLPKFMKKIEWFVELHNCDFCSGIWVYSVLSFFMGMDLLELTGFGYIPIIGAGVTGILVSWLMHLLTLGWKAKYEIVVI
jgi:hypothetical protein